MRIFPIFFSEFTAIPKPESVFKILIDNIELKIFGKHLGIRPAERAVKKIKTIMHPDLWSFYDTASYSNEPIESD